jgi:hypothetical protein
MPTVSSYDVAEFPAAITGGFRAHGVGIKAMKQEERQTSFMLYY